MKKLLLLLIIVVSTGTIFAQTKQGNFVLSGRTGLQFTASNTKYVYDGKTIDGSESKLSAFSIIPSVGYFVIDNLAVGLVGDIEINTDKSDDPKYVSSTTAILVNGSYYFPLEGKLRPFAFIGAGLASQVEKEVPAGEYDTKYSGICFHFGGGLSYFIKENISLDLGLSYLMANLKDADDNKGKVKYGRFNTNIGVSVYF
jgi:outer membrane protein